MSRAFTRDGQEGEEAGILPDRPISPERNLVTRRGLDLIEAAMAEARQSLATAEAQGDRVAKANATRDMRYWSARRASAERVEPADADHGVRFGMSVTLLYAGGRLATWRIVGEDEADPASGRVSHVAALARALYGKDVEDEISIGGVGARIVSIAVTTD